MRKRSLVVTLLGAAMLLLPQVTATADQLRVSATLDAASVARAVRMAHFAEPLVASAATSPEEDRALTQALAAYERRGTADDFSSLIGFLSKYSQSGWAPALLTNLGLSYLHGGRYSKALDAWQRAWAQGKGAAMPEARALVDRAVGELAMLYASLGKMAELSALFDEIGDRAVAGSATELIQVARETLDLSSKDPRHLFLCGPLSLQSVMLAQGVDSEQAAFLRWYRAAPEGTNLAELVSLADKAKILFRPVHRQPGEAVPVPSVVHMKLGHFAAIVGEADGRFHIRNASVRGGALIMTADALDSEASGYFLVPVGDAANSGWRSVDLAEAATIWGKGPTTGTRPGGVGTDIPANGKCNSGGMCAYDIKEATVSVALSDQPVGYVPAIGPSAQITVSYNQREDSQPANFSFFNVSQKWTLNWLSYVTDDPVNAGASVTRHMSGGGAFSYSGYSSTTGRFTAQDDDGSILVRVSASPIVYQRRLRDGGVETYEQSDGSAAYPRKVFLTRIADPQGNALALTYDGQLRLTSATDATGRQTTFSYSLVARPLLVTQITDPFGRSATFGYDSEGRLVSITDVIGLTSSFAYDANSLVKSMTTPTARRRSPTPRRAPARRHASCKSPTQWVSANARNGWSLLPTRPVTLRPQCRPACRTP